MLDKSCAKIEQIQCQQNTSSISNFIVSDSLSPRIICLLKGPRFEQQIRLCTDFLSAAVRCASIISAFIHIT